jgi:predicted dehydrogenase
MKREKIKVGIIGFGGWARYGHIPPLQSLKEDFEIVAVSSRNKHSAEKYAAEFNIRHAFYDPQELANHPEVDLVVITAPAPEHYRLVKIAISAGKDVYSEWPLTTNTQDSEELLALAEEKGVRHIVGFQRRMGPSARYMRDLVTHGYVGKLRSARMTVSADAFIPTMSQKHSWAFHASSFSNVLSIYGGHFMDMLFQAVGFPKTLTAVIENHFPFFKVEETGELVPTTNPNEAMIIGNLENGGLFSIQIEGAQKHRTGLQIDITGTDGVLKITNPLVFLNKDDNKIEGVNGDGLELSTIPIPNEYQLLEGSHLDASVKDVVYLYAAYARDKRNGTSEASNFKDALKQHQIIDQIIQTSNSFFEV